MIQPTLITWIIAVFGAITFLPLLSAQIIMLVKPQSRQAKDLIIGKGEEWRDETHFRSALAFAWADLLIIFPVFILGNITVLKGLLWGYVFWLALGILSIYFSIIFWILEKKYAFPSSGWLAYYTYFWGFFLYWGIAAIIYSLLQIV